MANPGAIFQRVGPIWGVYSVQVNSDDELQQFAQGVLVGGLDVAERLAHDGLFDGSEGGLEQAGPPAASR